MKKLDKTPLWGRGLIIHLILGKANPERMNGVNKVVYQLATKQAQTGRKVALWGITKDLSHNYGERNFETQLFKAHKNPFHIDKSLKSAVLVQKGKAVFHLHGGWIPVYASLAKFFAKHQIPFVLTPHGAYNTIAMQRSAFRKKIYFQLFEKTLLKNAQKIHAIGESEVEGLGKVYPNQKSFLLPYGFSQNQFLRIQRLKAIDNQNFIIGFVGRLDIYTKGLDLIIKAFQQFQEKIKHTKLWIIGDSDERTVLEKMIAENNIKNIKLWGKKFGNEKFELMKEMDIFVHASRNEGLPSAVLEASSLGIPSVVSKATNIGNFIEKYKAGMKVKNENIEDLTQAFLILHQSNLIEMGKNGQKMLSEVFDWEILVEKFEELYV